LVGSILIAGATSLPELAIDINAVRMGAPDLAVGDLVGSSLFNLLILAILDLTRYSRGQMLSKRSAAHALSAGTSVALTAIVAIFIFLGPKLGDATFLRLGPGSYVLIAAYFIGIRIIYFGQQRNAKPADAPEEATLPWLRKLGLKGAIIGYIAAAAAILTAAPFLAHAAEDLAERSGLGGTFFGTTFVALCTSLPEVVTTFSAVRMKAFDLALGNIFGSNCFNMLIFVPLDLVDDGSLLATAQPTHVYTALCVIVVTSVVILGQLFRVEKRKHFLEPDAWLAIALILASLTGLYFIRE
jgi:cation:H+ antiporter